MDPAKSGISGRIVAWIACLAILLGSLAPALGLPGHAAHHGSWYELCHDGGLAMVFMADGDCSQSPESHGDHASHHCPLCCGHSAGWALLPASPEIPAAPQQSPCFASLSFVAYTPHVWLGAQPRGPPVHS
ncbi:MULTISPECIES: DUF2946 domain-containing protein [Pseudomonadota]|uniref:DUF2946 domain-containing protein n=1 Tax=Pseudomonadota TaxID=1224 RepID=UPI0009BCDE3E|nr:DUF2946 domain-containing protein [Achromobacter xylosoxidans]HBO0525156.1 DUF2946 domain-containing protein [Pseudomonas aeruginosa]HBY2266933.1 DUF2946 domain-containing protein [Klebsiella pneumoniae]QPR94941.1 DUF2946 domain-containing protein [Achromobacter xylosoxidans]UON38884.1 DUF2946 domain-containing protein [Achromobacter xylosoxidans]